MPAAPGSLEWFLVERYLLFSADARDKLRTGRVHHTPYLIEPMPTGKCSTTPFAFNGFPEPKAPPVSLLTAEAVHVWVFPLRRGWSAAIRRTHGEAVRTLIFNGRCRWAEAMRPVGGNHYLKAARAKNISFSLAPWPDILCGVAV